MGVPVHVGQVCQSGTVPETVLTGGDGWVYQYMLARCVSLVLSLRLFSLVVMDGCTSTCWPGFPIFKN